MEGVSLPIFGAGGSAGDAPPARDALASLDPGPLTDRYAAAVSGLDRRLLDLTDEQLDAFFRPEAGVGRWSCRVVIGHLADAELVFVHRFRKTVAEEHPLLGGWDQDAFIDAGLYGSGAPVAGFVALLHTLRTFTAEWLRVLDEAAWRRRALRGELGERTLHGLVVDAAWHFEHHAWFLGRKIERLIGPARSGT